MLGLNLYLMLSLLACLLEERLPKAVPYIYQLVALAGYGNLLISKSFFGVFNEYTRFWYCFIYLLMALANIVAINVYFGVSKKLWTLAKVWAGAVTFPSVLVSMFFVSNYSVMLGAELPLLFLQVGLVLSAIFMGVCISIFLSPNILKKLTRRR